MGVAGMALPMVAEPSMPLQSARPIFARSHATETLPSHDSSLRHWLMTDPVPRVLVDRNLRVVWGNDAATAFLTERRDLEVRNAALGAVDSTQHALLVDAIGASTDTTRCWELLSAEDNHIVMQIRRLSDLERPLIAITFWRTETPRFANLSRVFELTKAEHSVLLKLLNGSVADSIAECHGVSLDTVRTQIRSIYAKLDVSSREGLFHKVMAYVL
jgi:DNA-binding CsgD family transcriptional regulator